MSKKIKKFFHTTADAVKKCRHRHPDGGKYRTKPPAEGNFPAEAAEDQPGAVTQPDVAPAYGETVDKPNIAHDPHKNQVCQMGMADPHRPEGTVAEPQPRPKQHPGPEAPGGKGRTRQPSRRPQIPPLFLGCS